jgi:hypothetical protein
MELLRYELNLNINKLWVNMFVYGMNYNIMSND